MIQNDKRDFKQKLGQMKVIDQWFCSQPCDFKINLLFMTVSIIQGPAENLEGLKMIVTFYVGQ